jgi:hypothetical protein
VSILYIENATKIVEMSYMLIAFHILWQPINQSKDTNCETVIFVLIHSIPECVRWSDWCLTAESWKLFGRRQLQNEPETSDCILSVLVQQDVTKIKTQIDGLRNSNSGWHIYLNNF